jgi:hypothetical protein
MQKWTVGDVTITRVIELEAPVPYHEKYPMIREARPESLREMRWLYPNFVGRAEYEHWRANGNGEERDVSRGERALITGDTMHHPCQIGRPLWSTSFDSDREAASAMRAQLLGTLADQPVLVIGTHFATPTAGRIKRDGTGYRFETD